MPRYRICLLSEGLGGSRDEGVRNFVVSLSKALGARHEVKSVGLDTGIGTAGDIKTNRLLLSSALSKLLRGFAPDAMIYVPLASSTLGAFVRSWILGRLYNPAPVVMIGLQPRAHGGGKRALIRLIHPDAYLAQDNASLSNIPAGFPMDVIPSGVDTSRFKPPEPGQKAGLRRSLGLGEADFVLLHVGHIRRERNVGIMGILAREIPCSPILVGSTSTAQDGDLVQDLQVAGVRVIREKVPDIQQFYQISDCYLFPVHSDQEAIEMPLSVLEAMAVNLPVVSTRFGSLTTHFAEGPGFWYFDRDQDLIGILRDIKKGVAVNNRELTAPYTWGEVARNLVTTLENWGLLHL